MCDKRRRTCIGCFLDGVVAAGALAGVEEGVVGEAVEEGGLLHHLEDGVLDRRGVCAGQWVQVQTDDRDSVRELLCQREV